jgi:hypothetical protein
MSNLILGTVINYFNTCNNPNDEHLLMNVLLLEFNDSTN